MLRELVAQGAGHPARDLVHGAEQVVLAHLVDGVPGRLADGAEVLGDRREHCDVWVIQREVTDPLSYVNLWLGDAGQTDPDRRDAWLDWFDAHRIEAVGFGIITARRSDRDDPVVRVEELRQPVEPPLGAQIAAWFDRQDWLRDRDVDALLDTSYVAAEGVRLRQEATLSPEGWAVEQQVLTLPTGLRWTEPADPFIVALVGGATAS